MKLFYLTLLLTLVGCSSQPKEESYEKYQSADSILQQSKRNLVIAHQASKGSDSSITEKVEKTVKQITTLQQENKQLKFENNALKIKLDTANDIGKPFKLLPVSNDQNNQ